MSGRDIAEAVIFVLSNFCLLGSCAFAARRFGARDYTWGGLWVGFALINLVTVIFCKLPDSTETVIRVVVR